MRPDQRDFPGQIGRLATMSYASSHSSVGRALSFCHCATNYYLFCHNIAGIMPVAAAGTDYASYYAGRLGSSL